MMPLLDVKNVTVNYKTEAGLVRAVNDVSLSMNVNETLGIVGESGCGKTTLGLSLIKLLPPNGEIINGKVLFEGIDLLKLPEDEIRKLRWRKFSMIFQNAMNALDPLYRVKKLLVEPLKIHGDISPADAERRVEDCLKLVGVPPSRMYSYPHELSGGMRQRVMIAMALICNPQLVIADEPTTALDVVIQDQILREIKDLRREIGFAMILITHNIAQVLERCDKISVMYGGETAEHGDSVSLFRDIRHPYTFALFRSTPSIRGSKKRLIALPGAPPNLLNPPSGCLFEPRCPIAAETCSKKKPQPVKVADGHYSSCHFALDSRLIKEELEDRFEEGYARQS